MSEVDINTALTRAVDSVYPTKDDLKKALESGKTLKLYQGFDPTGIQMHIGHMIGLRKLAQFQKLGHKVIFVIGDGTGQAGDPSGKTKARDKFLTQTELRKNAEDYVKQAGKIVNFGGDNPVEIRYNGDWLNKLTLPELLDIMGNLTLQQLSERDLFEQRKKDGIDVNLREFIYPVLQAYDSVEMEVDLEIGGSDQTFNMLMGRKLLSKMKNKGKFVLTTPLLTDSSGRKIGKTEGNAIALNDKPEELFGKIMALSDDVIVKGLEYLTDVDQEEINDIGKKIDQDENPVPFKKLLAFEIVKQLNSEEDANKAQQHFEQTIQQGNLPEVIEDTKVENSQDKSVNVDLLVELGLADSKSDAKRLFEQGGVKVDDLKISLNDNISVSDGQIIRVGKRKIIRIKTD